MDTVVLTDSKREEKNNVHFLQALRQATNPTSQVAIDFVSLTIQGSLEPTLSKFERKK